MTSIQRTDQHEGISTMVGGLAEDFSLLLKDQVALTKSELRQSVRTVAVSSGMLVGAAFLGLLAIIFLLITIAYGLFAAGLSLWASFGIVTLVLLIITAVLGLVGSRRIKTVKGPDRSITQLQKVPELLPGRTEQ
ncbi:MAG: phage holin family protein [Candidatus Nanopelagicales bacterium]